MLGFVEKATGLLQAVNSLPMQPDHPSLCHVLQLAFQHSLLPSSMAILRF